MALALPTARVRRCVPPLPGMMPSVISGWPNTAVSAARIMSHAIANSQPPPSAYPPTAAMIGFRQFGDTVERREKVAAIGLDEGLLVHLLDVHAGSERLVVAGDDDAADPAIGLEAVECAIDLADQLGIERVQRMRAVEGDDPDLALGRDEDGVIGAVAFRRIPRLPGGEDIQHMAQVP